MALGKMANRLNKALQGLWGSAKAGSKGRKISKGQGINRVVGEVMRFGTAPGRMAFGAVGLGGTMIAFTGGLVGLYLIVTRVAPMVM